VLERDNGKFSINYESARNTLTIMASDVDVTDSGNYFLNLSSNNGKVIGESLALTVEGAPVVSAVKMDEEYYGQGSEVEVQFKVISHPPPIKREWSCSPCYYKGAEYPSCDPSQSHNCIVSIFYGFLFLAYTAVREKGVLAIPIKN